MKAPHFLLRRQSRLGWQTGLSLALLLSLPFGSRCFGAGTILAWGANDAQQSQPPVGLTNVVAVAGGVSHSLALTGDGRVRAWGFNLSGQTNVPAGLTGVTAIAAGSSFSMALKSDGHVVLWGNIGGAPPSVTNVIAIAAGWSHCLALRQDHTVVAWGAQTSVPAGLENVVAIAAGNGQSLALKADGTITAWGDNSYNKTNVPVSATNIIAIAAGADHCLALKRDGTVFAWGRNDANQASVPTGLRAVAISGGALHSVALKTDGSLAAWGDNTYQQTVVNPGDNGFIAVSAGGYHNLAIRGDGYPFILSQPASQDALISKSAMLQVIATGAQPLTYQWQHFGTNLPGATTSTLNLPNVQATDGGPYQVLVGNVYSTVASATAVVNAIGGAPMVVSGPKDQTIICGDSATFEISVGGSSPFTYQWQFGSTPIDGATTTVLMLNNVTPAQAGQYSVTAVNPYGSVTASAMLSVTSSPPSITSALTASGTQGSAFNYRIRALHNPNLFQAIYLPAGLLVDTNTGVISGIPAESGTFGALITAFNACSSATETLVITIAPSLPSITSPALVSGTEGLAITPYQITATASPISYGASNLPVGLSVNRSTGIISGVPTYAGEYDSTIWASNVWGAGYANLHFSLANGALDNLNIGNVTYNYSKPYLLDFQFSLYTINGDTNDPTSPITGVVVDPSLLSATCLEDDVPNSQTETSPFMVRGNSKVVKVYLVLDFTESIASLANGDQNGDGISDAVEFMVQGAQDFVNQQPYDTQIGVIEFHRDDMAPSNVVALTTDKALINSKIAGIYTNYVQGFSSGSRCWDALSAAITGLGSSNRDEQHFVVFVSDGRDESSTKTFANVTGAAGTAAVKIFALGFGDELDATTLQNLTAQTQGRYFAAGNDPSALASQFAEISKSAKGQYILRWATLKRSSKAFMPSFQITYRGITAYSPTNPVSEVITNDPMDTNTPPAQVTNYVTNFIIAYYTPTSNAPPPAVTAGSLRMVPNKEVLPTGLDLRATYAPRNIRQMRFHYRANYLCTPTLQSAGPGDILSGWTLTQTNDGSGGVWMLLSSPNPANPATSIPFAAFGKLVTFTFPDVINPTNAFSFFDVDNTLYTNTGGQTFSFENTNEFIKSFPLLPYGTPVPWLQTYGYSNNYTNAELLDPDNDGMPNWKEYRANTNPTNAASVFMIRSVTRGIDGRFQVTFSTSINRTYRLDASTDLVNWQTVQDNIPAVNADVTIVDPRYVPSNSIYYRVLVY